MRDYLFNANALSILVPVTIATLAGDYFIKLAAGSGDQKAYLNLLIGSILYGASAVGWFMLMRTHSLAVIGVLYSATNIVLLAALGYFVFNEPANLNQVVGLLLAVTSVAVMSY